MGGFRIARIIGIPIYIHYTWFVIFGLIAWSLSEGYFPSRYPDLPASTYWAKGLVAALLLFGSVLFHELGHSIVAIRNGIGIVSITLFIFGGLARLKQDPNAAWVEFKVAIAGPMASFFLAGFFYAAAQLEIGGAGGVAVTTYLALLNMILGTFNLVPAFPLDGGRVLRAVLWKFAGKMKATRIASGIGTFFAYLLILHGVYGLVRGEGLNGVWSILIGWFLKDASAGAYQQVRLSEMLSGVRVRDLMVPNCVAIPVHISIEEAVQDYFLRYGYGGFPVEDRGSIRGLLTLSDVKRIPRENWSNTSVQAHMSPVDQRTTIAADKDITEALQQMAQSGISRLIVVDTLQNCIGMITHNGILTRLQAQEALDA
jgi:Zn-dependent protease/predicted transcriptional regulator